MSNWTQSIISLFIKKKAKVDLAFNPIDEYQKIKKSIDEHDSKVENDIIDSLIFDYPAYEKYLTDKKPINIKDLTFWYLEDKSFSEYRLIKKNNNKSLEICLTFPSFSSSPDSLRESLKIIFPGSKYTSSKEAKDIIMKYIYCYKLSYIKLEKDSQEKKSKDIYDVLGKQSKRDSILSSILN